ncbi:MAG TPA: 5-formyltetrahydrofolate cyclo-ligase, partial [Candidatus Dormibacteraeota bacterium]|nr:5-formyltetrahydrofolate cyclo-ligase [Candidatus Dormibacteraeota bacterium]
FTIVNSQNPPGKSQLRDSVRRRIREMAETERREASERAVALCAAQPLWERSSSILLFAPLVEELDAWPLLAEGLRSGKQMLLPRYKSGHYVACEIKNPDMDLEPGKFGIREPTGSCRELSLNRLDLVLVPGIAFDLQGRRLGRGKGFYDRLLAEVRGTTCGVAFDEQIVPEVPVEPHDKRVDCILTPTRWIELWQRAGSE